MSVLLNVPFEHLRTWLQKSRPMQKFGSGESRSFFTDICDGKVGAAIAEQVLTFGGGGAKLTVLSRFAFFTAMAGDRS